MKAADVPEEAAPLLVYYNEQTKKVWDCTIQRIVLLDLIYRSVNRENGRIDAMMLQKMGKMNMMWKIIRKRKTVTIIPVCLEHTERLKVIIMIRKNVWNMSAPMLQHGCLETFYIYENNSMAPSYSLTVDHFGTGMHVRMRLLNMLKRVSSIAFYKISYII